MNLDASYLEEMGKLGTIFSDKTTHPCSASLFAGERWASTAGTPCSAWKPRALAWTVACGFSSWVARDFRWKVWRTYTSTSNLPLWGVHRHRTNAIAYVALIEEDGTAKTLGYGPIVVKQIKYDEDMTVLDE